MGCKKLTYHETLSPLKVVCSDLNISGISCVGAYRYGFQGQEMDDEVKGAGNSYDFGARLYDPRVGRWLSIDPQAKKQPDQSPYKAMFNNPIFWVDPDGKTEYQTVVIIDEKSGKKMRMYVAKSSKVMTDGEVTSQQAITNPTRYQRYYDYAHVTTYRFTTDGNIIIEKSTEILYKNKVKHFEDVTLDNLFGATEDYGHVYDPDDSYAQSGGFYMTGSNGQGTKYHSDNAEYVGNMDALIDALGGLGSAHKIKNTQKLNTEELFKIVNNIASFSSQVDQIIEQVDKLSSGIESSSSGGSGNSQTGQGGTPGNGLDMFEDSVIHRTTEGRFKVQVDSSNAGGYPNQNNSRKMSDDK